ncbi:MAG: SIS domain-containing protein [Planctomycetota bacterium]|nr:SIS domain-containing protein [Planctomycetota bacterium]
MTLKATSHFRRLGELLAGTAVTGRGGQAIPLDDGADRAVRLILETKASGAKVLIVGNGGSAAIAGHLELDLCNRGKVRAMAFNNAPVLTALANDHGYATAFERLVGFWGAKGDVLVAISSSGKSENIHRPIRALAYRGCTTITFSGFAPDNPLRAQGDLNFYVASSHYGEVEVSHEALIHFVIDRVVDVAMAAASGNPAPASPAPSEKK